MDEARGCKIGASETEDTYKSWHVLYESFMTFGAEDDLKAHFIHNVPLLEEFLAFTPAAYSQKLARVTNALQSLRKIFISQNSLTELGEEDDVQKRNVDSQLMQAFGIYQSAVLDCQCKISEGHLSWGVEHWEATYGAITQTHGQATAHVKQLAASWAADCKIKVGRDAKDLESVTGR